MFKTWKKRLLPNPLDRLLKRARKEQKIRFLFGWNRGLGDIPLGIYPLVEKVRSYIPGAKITFVTRPDLEQGFSLLPEVDTIVEPTWKRGEDYQLPACLVTSDRYDFCISHPDPTYWCQDMLGKCQAKLTWNSQYDQEKLPVILDPNYHYIAVHSSPSNLHGPWRSWPEASWQELFTKILNRPQARILLFGAATDKPKKQTKNVIDLRGKTSLYALISIIKNYCRDAVLLDSGILSILYYINLPFALNIVSLWAKPLQGVMKSGVLSPNPLLSHQPLIGDHKDLSKISPCQVFSSMELSKT